MTNIILVVMDTARYKNCLSDPAEGLSLSDAAGTVFTQAMATAPWTLPSHASLFTGTSPTKHGAHAGHKYLEPELKTLPEVFTRHGYETTAVSNNTWISEEFGFSRGFGTMYKTWQYIQTNTDFGKIAREKEGLSKYLELSKLLFEGNPLINLTNVIYGQFFRKTDDAGAARTCEWIGDWLADRDDSRPFFLFVNYLEPHLEYRPPEEFAERFLPAGVSYDEAMDVPQDAWGYIAGKTELSDRDFEVLRALYRTEIAYLDHRIGELRDLLEEHGEWEDTVFVVTGDHGENIGDHGLMDHQYSLHDTLLHVPLVIHGGSFTGGGTVDDLVQLTDLAPTLLDEVGIDAPEFREQAQGRSFHPDADTEPRDRVVAEYMAPQPSMEALEKRVGDLPAHVYEYDRSLRALRTEEWKLIRGSDGSRRLYHVASDPEESEDVADENPEVVSRLEGELDEWLDSFEHAEHTGDVSMREETRERLEDLGYLQ